MLKKYTKNCDIFIEIISGFFMLKKYIRLNISLKIILLQIKKKYF
jgi:hypothetical protein